MQIKTETIVGLFVLTALAIFFYMSFYLGVFRLNRGDYNQYTVYFDDISGLEKKADVKIAGVKVGWINSIDLIDGHYQAKASISVRKRYILRSDSYGIVRQEGLVGAKYLEVMPGDPLLPALAPGQTLGKPSRGPVSMDDILHKVTEIASNVEDVTSSFQATFGGPEGTQQLKSMFENFQQAAEKFAAFSAVLDRDIGRIATKVESTSGALEDAALQVRDGFKNIVSITEKIDEGKGIFGKLINEDETYRDLKVTIQGIKNYVSKIDSLNIVVDSHGEYMYRPAEHVTFEDAKGYLDLRVHPNEDHFWLLQIMSSQKGSLYRKVTERSWFDENCNPLLPSELLAQGVAIPQLIGTIQTTKRKLDQFKFGFQFAKIFRDIALRFGLFENTAGMAIDIDLPFGCPDKFRWVTSIEAFDFRGRDRIDDKRPHLKWINRIFFLRNLYFNFGADDFVSKFNANGFFGAGLRFNDDDLKYIISQLMIIG